MIVIMLIELNDLSRWLLQVVINVIMNWIENQLQKWIGMAIKLGNRIDIWSVQ